jgi:hypothetical protein
VIVEQENTTALVVLGEPLPGALEPLRPAALYRDPALVDAVLAQATQRARNVAAGLTADTASGRKAIASVAYRVARTKTALDEAGKQLVSDIKAQAATIDSERRRIREALDQLKADIARPVTLWEIEEEGRKVRIEKILSRLRALPRMGLSVAEIDAAIAEAQAVEPSTCDERAADCRALKLQVLDLLATARQQAVDAEALAAERARLDEERRRLDAEQAAAEAARLAAQRAQDDADRRAAEAAAAAERAALQAAVAQAQQEVARLTVASVPEPVPAAVPARVEPTVPTWRVTDKQLQYARAWAVALESRSPMHAALVRALLGEIDGWRAGV